MRFIVDIDMEDVKDDIFDSEIWFFAFKKVIDSDSVGGKILWVLVLWPFLLLEICLGLIILALGICLGIPYLFFLCICPILNIYVLKESIDEDCIPLKIMAIIGIIFDNIVLIFCILIYSGIIS